MARTPTWEGLLKGVLVLGMLWWAWVGYAWLTSVVDPEEGSVRLVIFAAMAAMLVAALCVPGAFGSEALLFACAYAIVRGAHIALFTIASREDPALRHSVAGLAYSTAIAAGLLFVAAATSGALQIGLWGLALVLDMGGPFLFGAEGWKLVPGHFAERNGLIVLIALGESIVALGVGAKVVLDAGTVVAAVLGVVVAAALWWVYFDVTAIVAERRLSRAAEGRERNEIARDSYSYLHFPMVAGIALLAVGLKLTLEDVERIAQARAGLRAARRSGVVPARARRVPLAQHAHAQPPQVGVRCGPDRARARHGRGEALIACDPRCPRGDPHRVDRLRGGALRGRARAGAPRRRGEVERPGAPVVVEQG